MRKFTEMDRARMLAALAAGQSVKKRSGLRTSKLLSEAAHRIRRRPLGYKLLSEYALDEEPEPMRSRIIDALERVESGARPVRYENVD